MQSVCTICHETALKWQANPDAMPRHCGRGTTQSAPPLACSDVIARHVPTWSLEGQSRCFPALLLQVALSTGGRRPVYPLQALHWTDRLLLAAFAYGEGGLIPLAVNLPFIVVATVVAGLAPLITNPSTRRTASGAQCIIRRCCRCGQNCRDFACLLRRF
jgi:hypothetical protein